MTKVDLITGILGAGKTTFIKKYAGYLLGKGLRIAILENDFGAVNVDMMILQELRCENCAIEMISGGCDPDCHKRRFKTQLIALGMQHFDRVIIEPSGIFDMDEFFDLIHDSPLDRWFEIGSIITIADPETDEFLSEQMEYLLASQASCCGKLVVSKINPDENFSKDTVLNKINNALSAIKCDRKLSEKDIFIKNWDNLNDEDFENIKNSSYRCSSYVKKFNIEDIGGEVHYFMHIKLPDDLIEKITCDIMSDEKCGNITRLKGFLPCSDGWLKINITPEKSEISPVSDGQPVIITIGKNINKNTIDEYFKKYNSDSEYVSI